VKFYFLYYYLPKNPEGKKPMEPQKDFTYVMVCSGGEAFQLPVGRAVKVLAMWMVYKYHNLVHKPTFNPHSKNRQVFSK